MLRAKDNKDREKIVRRKVELVSEIKKEETKSTETKVSKTAKANVLDYTTPRLWTKPAKILKKQSAVENVEIEEQVNISETSANTRVNTQTTTTTTTTTTKSVVNPTASPDQEGLAYDPSLEELL